MFGPPVLFVSECGREGGVDPLSLLTLEKTFFFLILLALKCFRVSLLTTPKPLIIEGSSNGFFFREVHRYIILERKMKKKIA